MQRTVDVLHLVLAAIGEGDVDPPADVLVDGVGDRDPARLGKAFDAGGDVDAVAEDVVAVDDDVADMNADPVLQEIGLGRAVAAPGHRRLEGDAALHRVHGGGEFNQQAVAGRLDDPAAMLGDRRIDHLGARPPSAAQAWRSRSGP